MSPRLRKNVIKDAQKMVQEFGDWAPSPKALLALWEAAPEIFKLLDKQEADLSTATEIIHNLIWDPSPPSEEAIQYGKELAERINSRDTK